MSREQEFLNAVQKGDVTKAKELLKTDRTLAKGKASHAPDTGSAKQSGGRMRKRSSRYAARASDAIVGAGYPPRGKRRMARRDGRRCVHR